MKQKTFLDYYKFPLKIDPCSEDDLSVIVFTEDGNRVFDFNSPSQLYSFQDTVDKINGKDNSGVIYKASSLTYRPSDCMILGKDDLIISIRGWGYLTGTCKLSCAEALKIQDDLAEYIINKLTNHNL